MAAPLTKERRQDIVREFAIRHNGQYDPGLFLQEVKEKGKKHPAHGWFEWDANKAAHAHQLNQARDFARDLRVTFRVEEVTAPHSVRVRETPMPMVISPMSGRSKGGGYVLVDPNSPEHMEEHRRQAARALQQWLDRYAAALADAKIKASDVEKLIGKLEIVAPNKIRAQHTTSPQAVA